MLSTSQNKKVGYKFANGFTLIKINIPKNCFNAGKIGHLSEKPNEQEVLIPAYSWFKVAKTQSYYEDELDNEFYRFQAYFELDLVKDNKQEGGFDDKDFIHY